MKKGSTVIVFQFETGETDKVEWMTKKGHQQFFDKLFIGLSKVNLTVCRRQCNMGSSVDVES